MSEAQADCEVLMKSVVGFAERMLTTHGGFIPFGGAMRPDGQIVPVAGHDASERPQSSDIIALMKKGLVASAQKGEYKATAVVCDVRVDVPSTGEKSDAIAVSLNHRDNYSIVVFFPYRIDNGKLIPGAAFARNGEADIFRPS